MTFHGALTIFHDHVSGCVTSDDTFLLTTCNICPGISLLAVLGGIPIPLLVNTVHFPVHPLHMG